MTEKITSALAKILDLRVVARSLAFEFKGQNKEARAMGQALGATRLIEGSVRKAGNRVHIMDGLDRMMDCGHILATKDTLYPLLLNLLCGKT